MITQSRKWMLLMAVGLGTSILGLHTDVLRGQSYGTSPAASGDAIVRPTIIPILLNGKTTDRSFDIAAILRSAMKDMARKNREIAPNYPWGESAFDPWIENIVIVENPEYYMVVFCGRNNGQLRRGDKVYGAGLISNYVGYIKKYDHSPIPAESIREPMHAPIIPDLARQANINLQYKSTQGADVKVSIESLR